MPDINYRPDPARAPTDFDVWMDDFHFYLATSYVNSETGSGTRAIAQAKGGILLVTNAGADNDRNFFQNVDVASGQVAEHYKFVLLKSLYFGCRFKTSDATQTDILFGLQITDTTPLAVTDGIFFRKDDDARIISLVGCKNSTESVSNGVDGTSGYLVSDTYTTLEFLYDPSAAKISGYQDGINFASIPLTNVVDDEELAISWGIQNGAAAAKTLSVDWIRVVAER